MPPTALSCRDQCRAPTPVLDWLGFGLGMVCALHCMAVAALLTLGGAMMGGLGWLAVPDVHRIALALAVLVALMAFWRGLRRGHWHRPTGWAFCGLALMALGLFWPFGGPHLPIEIGLTLVGGQMLAWAHWINGRLLPR